MDDRRWYQYKCFDKTLGLRGSVRLKIHTPMPQHLHGLRVCDLLMPNQRCWDVPFLREIFDDVDVANILKTPLLLASDDRRIWHYSGKGDYYSVKTGYRVVMNLTMDSGALKLGTVPGCWTKIWDLNVQPKIRNFIWR